MYQIWNSCLIDALTPYCRHHLAIGYHSVKVSKFHWPIGQVSIWPIDQVSIWPIFEGRFVRPCLRRIIKYKVDPSKTVDTIVWTSVRRREEWTDRRTDKWKAVCFFGFIRTDHANFIRITWKYNQYNMTFVLTRKNCCFYPTYTIFCV